MRDKSSFILTINLVLFALISFDSLLGQSTSQIFNIKDYGAKGDGDTKDTVAIQDAIDVCSQNGGGTVWGPEDVACSPEQFFFDPSGFSLST